MPIFEYVCCDCQKRYEELVQTLAADNPPCPACGSKKVERTPSAFASFGCGDKSAPAGLGGGFPPAKGCGSGGFS